MTRNNENAGPPFTARFDRIFFSSNVGVGVGDRVGGGLRLVAVRAPRSPADAKANLPLPNVMSASDHLPIAAVFELM